MVTKMSTMVCNYCYHSTFIAEQSHLRPDSKPVGSTETILQQFLGATWTRHHLL